jgi:hypothetical protein
MSGTGGAGRVRQRAGELRHVARLGVVAFPGRLLRGSLLKPGVHLGEAKAPVPGGPGSSAAPLARQAADP